MLNKTKDILGIFSLLNSCSGLIQNIYDYDELDYDGNELEFNGKKLTKQINDLKNIGVLDYDEENFSLSLSLQSEDYLNFLLGEAEDTNISVIEQKIHVLKNTIKEYKIRVRADESTAKEEKKIFKLLNHIPSILRLNIKTISSTSVFAYKNESNYEIKMIKLKQCRKDIEALLSAIDEVDKYLKNNKYEFFHKVNNDKIKFAQKRISLNNIKLREAVISLRKDNIKFLNQTIQDGEFFKKLSKLYTMKKENELEKKSDFLEKINNFNFKSKSFSIKSITPDDIGYDIADELRANLEQRKLESIIAEKKTYEKIDSNSLSKVKKLSSIDYKVVYNDFRAQEKDLITYLFDCENIPEEKCEGIMHRIIIKWFKMLEIQQKQRVEINEILYPKIYPRIINKREIDVT